jgi:hypothetical protein
MDVLRSARSSAGLEAWWKAPADRLGQRSRRCAGEADPFERGRAEAVVIGYDARWGDEAIECSPSSEFCTSP